ncbi:sensor histidine kinase [Chitinophaga varians]|uniref:sensor histidine kinase n=1 Tax=Chitinophaga varians TaxID=2202339 RepID=UPI00165F5FA9|nr:histidine kinase [Chitinophaga varians]MBC9911835.1 histidine kinase [Chitinophaga varians]
MQASQRKTIKSVLQHLIPAAVIYGIVGMNDYQLQWQPLMKILGTLFILTAPYVNQYLLVPQLLLRFRYYAYAVGVLVLISLLLGVTVWTEPLVTPLLKPGKAFTPYQVKDVLVFFVMMLSLVAASTAIPLFWQWVQASYHRTASLQTELENLKKQLSPHFLFNTLNNLDTLIYADQHRASTVVHSLSRLLRYQLYLSGSGQVCLRQELEFMEDFLYLEQLRHDMLDVRLTVDDGVQDMLLHPFLLMPFVENAVKHNEYNGNAYIHLHISVISGCLRFTCVNPVSRRPVANGGAGLNNVRRRLSLLYPGRHMLQTDNNGEVYTVALTFNI